ncbi:MAG: hypothetical protein R3A78_05060 [Polyangiales bacterium]
MLKRGHHALEGGKGFDEANLPAGEGPTSVHPRRRPGQRVAAANEL